MMSGGLPPTKRGCSSAAICVDGRHLDGRALVGLVEDVGGELDVVDAVAAVEDHGVDGGVVGDAERVDRIDAGRGGPFAARRDGRRADDAGLAEVRRERRADADGGSAAEESTSVGGCLIDLALVVHFVVHTFLVECRFGMGEQPVGDERSLPLELPPNTVASGSCHAKRRILPR